MIFKPQYTLDTERAFIGYTGTANNAAEAYALACRLSQKGFSFMCSENLFFRVHFRTKEQQKKLAEFKASLRWKIAAGGEA